MQIGLCEQVRVN